MEEQASWKGHGFTLLVFGGIVFLCSIFFVLGMLVGRGQGQRSAETAVVNAAAKAASAETRIQSQETTSPTAPYEGVETGKQTTSKATPSPEPVKQDPPVVVVEPKPEPKAAAVTKAAAAPPTPVKMLYLQVGALEKESAANEEVSKLEKNGFSVLKVITADGPKKLFKIQVGPFSNVADAEIAKNKLKSMGYMPIQK